mgnify:FL=1
MADMSARFTATPQEIYFEVSGVPQPKKCAAYGRHFQCYNPSKLAEQEFVGVVQSLCERSLGSVPKFAADALVKVRIDFFFPCNCTSNRVKRKILLRQQASTICVSLSWTLLIQCCTLTTAKSWRYQRPKPLMRRILKGARQSLYL